MYFLFFYPLALSHLGLNDLIDFKNDLAKEMNTITVLYDIKGTIKWILAFNILHFITAISFLLILSRITMVGFLIPFGLLSFASYKLVKDPTPKNGLKILPLYHISMALYSVSLIIGSLL